MSKQDAGPAIPCPACGAALYGWGIVRGRGAVKRVVDHCEDCGLLVTRAEDPVDVTAELAAVASGPGVYAAPNRRSVQGGLGGVDWAALDPGRRLHMTPRSAKLLLEHEGLEVGSIRFPRWGRNVGWMWQTLLNGLTFNRNFAHYARAGEMRPRNLRERVLFTIDALVSVLAALPAVLVAVPLELIAASLRRGGEMVLEARPRPREDGKRPD